MLRDFVRKKSSIFFLSFYSHIKLSVLERLKVDFLEFEQNAFKDRHLLSFYYALLFLLLFLDGECVADTLVEIIKFLSS